MLQLDGIEWKIGKLGKQVLVLEPEVEAGHLNYIHRFNSILDKKKLPEVLDVVPAYKSVAIFYNGEESSIRRKISELNFSAGYEPDSVTHEIEVNYDLALDWDRVCSATGFSKSECIERHTKPRYKVAMIGFLPGFIFLEGLGPALSVPRMETPRTRIPAGSLGIGGVQTGIYSLESPGGWNIIGRTQNSFFDIKNDPPISIKPGDRVCFKPQLG